MSNITTIKPPLGIKPRAIINAKRGKDIIQAMHRYITANKPIPEEWIHELRDLNLIEKFQ